MDNRKFQKGNKWTEGKVPGVSGKRRLLNQDRSTDHLLCKICLQVYWEPFSTLCGHTFCRSCIEQHLAHNSRCPICDTNLDPKKCKIIPNFTVAALVEKILLNDASEFNKTKVSKKDIKDEGKAILEMLVKANNIGPTLLKEISDLVECKRLEFEIDDEFLRNILLYEFLEKMIEKRKKQAENLQIHLERLRTDKRKVAEFLHERAALFKNSTSQQQNQQQQIHEQQQLCLQQNQRVVPDVVGAQHVTTTAAPIDVSEVAHSSTSTASTPPTNANEHSSDGLQYATSCSLPAQTHANETEVPPVISSLSIPSSQRVREALSKYRRRLITHINSLEYAYFNPRVEENVAPVGSCSELDEFSQIIRGMSQYGSMRQLATLNYNIEGSMPHSIVSSIEFDKDGEYFAVASVTRKIKIYDFNLTAEYMADNPYPVQQLQCNSKISNVSWNPYSKHLLASSDYDGTVQLWDTNVGRSTRSFREHSRRCWTVQFNNVDPHLMASGSDDSRVKLWSVTSPTSLCTIDAKANVCCVHFSPQSKNHLVFGSADHCVHLYDIRNPARALSLFCGHRKAVSYVKYCNESEVVSASTDGDLRIWNVNSYKCLRTLRGHQNEQHFVGLATDGNHVMCGSENNHLYLYYKNISEPLLSFDFDSKSVNSVIEPRHEFPPLPLRGDEELMADGISPSIPFLQQAKPPQHQQHQKNTFVSAICWKKNSNVIVAANSQGTTHILQLI